ncbi:sodium/pantothenate symporter [Nocardiopsis ansamitocini]|uniref:Sodium/panthothenate symporter n=1 Tax=Nocardiopsis ansamitocini TaxID=1670832 RepID=A0A9W6PBH8_9ACTN|nr:sodium/pantothenate symporter [Nocardiopsis ansamitocini]GLU50514.1 sodium/panthothenate symporter [Nocardiopsis ansamitocini]
MRWGVIIPILVYVVLLMVIAWWSYRKRRQVAEGAKTEHYYMGGRSLGWLLLMFTLLASAASAGTFIGGPGLVYGQGYGWILVSIFQVPTAFIALAVLGKKFAILGRKLNALSIVDVLRHRYESPFVVILSSLGIVVFLTAYMVPQFVGGTRLLQAATGANYTFLLVALAVVIAIYTTFGGFLADAVSDVLQGIIMVAGAVVVWVALLVAAGGMGPVNEHVMSTSPELFTLPGPAGFTPMMIASYSLQLGLMFGVLPHLAVRAMSYRDSKSVHTAMKVGPLVMTVITLGFLTMGMVARFYQPDMAVGDLALPTTIIEVLPEGVAGILFAAPLAAVMSTVDAMILVVSGTIIRDLYVTYVNPRVSDGRTSTITSMTTLGLTGLVLYLAMDPPDYLELLIIYAIGGLEVAFFFPLVLGLYWKRANALGAALGMIGGMSWYTVVNFWVPELALGMFPIATSSAVALTLFLLGSYFGPRPRREVLVKFWGTQREIDKLGEAVHSTR